MLKNRLPNGPRKRRSSIRKSTEADIKVIYSWLVSADAEGIEDSFLCNWNVIKKSHAKSELLVYVDGESGEPVAFRCGDLLSPGLLEVRHDLRRIGIGRKLVERCITDARKEDECILYIQCKPSTSIPFWESMGFTIFCQEDRPNYAYRILEKAHTLPLVARPIRVGIRFYPEARLDDSSVQPYVTASPHAAISDKNIVYLDERVTFFKTKHSNEGDPIVEIEVDGQELYLGKAKYPEAEQLGVIYHPHGFYIDTIRM